MCALSISRGRLMALSVKMQFTEQSTRYDDSLETQKTIGSRFLVREGRKKRFDLHHGGKTEERTRTSWIRGLVDRLIDRITTGIEGRSSRNRPALRKRKRGVGREGEEIKKPRNASRNVRDNCADVTLLCRVAQFPPVHRGGSFHALETSLN